jgi:hypothetical protein
MSESERYIGKNGCGVPREIFDGQFVINQPVTCGSGETILVDKTDTEIYLRQRNNEPPLFIAQRFGYCIAFNIMTVGFIGSSNNRHPDLFAAKLMEESIAYFGNIGYPIELFKATWLFHSNEINLISVNALKFWEETDGLRNWKKPILETAAWSTWTGSVARSLGFDSILKIGKIFYPKSRRVRGVHVLFTNR